MYFAKTYITKSYYDLLSTLSTLGLDNNLYSLQALQFYNLTSQDACCCQVCHVLSQCLKESLLRVGGYRIAELEENTDYYRVQGPSFTYLFM